MIALQMYISELNKTKPKMSLPVHFLKGLRKLTVDDFEEALVADFKKCRINSVDELFTVTNVRNGLLIDLSQVMFVNLSVAVQLTLVIERIIKQEIQVFVALPTLGLTSKEEASEMDSSLKNSLREARFNANNFLKNIGFDRASQCNHLKSRFEVLLTEKLQFGKELTAENFDEAFIDSISPKEVNEKGDYRYLYPLEWINCSNDKSDFRELESRLTMFLQSPDRGLDIIDVQGIKNVILSELIKNVREHAFDEKEDKYGLLGIGLIDSRSLFKKKVGTDIIVYSNTLEEGYINWLLTKNIRSQVEIYFGDSGKGILSDQFIGAYDRQFNKSGSRLNQLGWAFEKWSTRKQDEKIRGTKGLYRIGRLVNKYNGIYHIRTETVDGGYQKGGYQQPVWVAKEKLAKIPGSLIQIKLCPFVEVIRNDLRLQASLGKQREWRSVRFRFTSDFTGHQILEFEDLVKLRAKQASYNHLFILDLPENIDSAQKILEEVLPKLSFYSHPAGCVVYLNSDLQNDTLETIVSSTNSLLFEEISNPYLPEIQHEDFEDVHDPIMVVGKNDRVFWFGGTEELIEILNEASSKQNGSVELNGLSTYQKLSSEFRRRLNLYFNNDNSLVYLDKKGNLSLNFVDVSNLYQTEIQKLYLESNRAKGEEKLCSPKLEIISKWFDIKDLLDENESGFAFALYLRLKSAAPELVSKLTKAKTYILIDHVQQKELASKFSELLGIGVRNIIDTSRDVDTSIPKRTRLFKKGDQVIVLTTLVSSSETIRRLVKYAKRDGAHPLVILSLGNGRNKSMGKLQTWGDETKIISLYQHHSKESVSKNTAKNADQVANKLETLSKINRWVEPNYTVSRAGEHNVRVALEKTKLNLSISDFFIKTKSMHYNHVGIYGKRHFTFYVNKDLVISKEGPIWDKLREKIEYWKLKRKIASFSLVLNGSLSTTEGGASFRKFLEAEITPSIYSLDDLGWKSKNAIVYLDFGSITGKAIRDFVSDLGRNTDELMICLVFNQSMDDAFKFLERVKLLRAPDDDKYDFSDLLETEKSGELPLNGSTKITVEKLFDLPLQYYSSQSCPICEHNRALDYYSVGQDYLTKFTEDRQNRLRIREREDIHHSEFPFDFYQDEDNLENELSSVVISNMFRIKLLLENALTSTAVRIEIFRLICEIRESYEELKKDCESILYSLIYFLSIEVHWLQHEPLVFRDFRVLLSEIACQVSLMKIEELSEFFKATNSTVSSPHRLAVRYKYAGITLLRSSNKLLFSKSIHDIISTSFWQGRLSNNLCQNTFYHLASLYKNDYNRSEKYFEEIEIQLNGLNNDDIALTIEQELTLLWIRAKNKEVLKSIRMDNLCGDYEVIKNLKLELEEVYNTNHPYPTENMTKLYLPRYNSIFQDFEIRREQAIMYSVIAERKDILKTHWNSVYIFISEIIFFHLEKLSEHFYKSDFFRNNFSSTFNLWHSREDLQRFTELVYLVSDNLSNYNIHREEFARLYNSILQVFIRKEGVLGELYDSSCLELVNQFPSNLLDVVQKVFSNSEISNIDLSDNLNVNVFFPKQSLLLNLDLILNNIQGKLNPDTSLSQVHLKLESEEIGDNYVQMKIEYSGTDKYSAAPNEKGSLHRWNKELNVFKGKLDAKMRADGYYELKVMMRKYE